MNYLQISIPTDDPAIREILVALLEQEGFEGFEEQNTSLQAFIPENLFDETILRQILEPHNLTYTSTTIGETNWNAVWEKDFQPVAVDDFCLIRAAFHEPRKNFTHEILITPKMSFGTGHHATTYMMIQAMRDLDPADLQNSHKIANPGSNQKPDPGINPNINPDVNPDSSQNSNPGSSPKPDWSNLRVLDFGTGTGILAILAGKLGARDILAIDNDDWSIDNAKENIRENDTAYIEVKKGDSIPAEGPFDIILANVNRQVILGQLANMKQQLTQTGVILLSGLLEEDFEVIEKEVVKTTLPISRRLNRSGWICLMLSKKDV